MSTDCDNSRCSEDSNFEVSTHRGIRRFCSDGCLSEWQEIERHSDLHAAEMSPHYAAADYKHGVG